MEQLPSYQQFLIVGFCGVARVFSSSETREYAPVLRIPGDCCAGYYRSDPTGYSDPAPD
jgi:hypothetical protein